MTSQTRWWGPALDEEQRDLLAMLDDFISAHPPVLDDDPAVVSALVGELAGLGIWTLGTADGTGGGGAGRALTMVAFERLGRVWPALGWAAVQAHAAVDAVAGDERCAALVADLHNGSAAVGVVDADAAHVRLTWSGDRLACSVDRVDAAAEQPHLLVLTGADSALLVSPAALTPSPVRRTGLGGALTRSVAVAGARDEVIELTGVDVAAAHTRLRLGAAAVAAGIAGAAADAAAEYAAGRRQFGAALTMIPTVRQSLLDQAAGAVTALAATFTADGPVHALAAVRLATDTAIEIAAAAVQSHGGYGYLAEYAAERYLRDAVSLRAAVDTRDAAVALAHTLVGLAPAATGIGKDRS